MDSGHLWIGDFVRPKALRDLAALRQGALVGRDDVFGELVGPSNDGLHSDVLQMSRV